MKPFKTISRLMKGRENRNDDALREDLIADGYGLPTSLTAPHLSFWRMSRDGYERIVWVNRCVRVIAESLGTVPLKLMINDSEPPDDHPASMLLRKPEPGVALADWVELWVNHMMLAGESWAEIIRSGNQGPPLSLKLLQLERLEVQEANTKVTVLSYKEPGSSLARTIMPSDTVHWRIPNPTSPHRGLSPLVAANSAIQVEMRAALYLDAFFRNQATPSGTLEVPEGVPERALEWLKTEMRDRFTGHNAFRPLILRSGAKWSSSAASNRDMQLTQIRLDQGKQVAAVLGVPAFMIGLAEPKYENYRAAVESFWLETIIPLARRLTTGLEGVISAEWPGAVVEYDLGATPAGRSLFSNRVDIARKLLDLGYPLNMVNKRLQLGMDDVPHGEDALIRAGLVPASMLMDDGIDGPSMPGDEDTRSEPPMEDPEEEDE